jgi:hypothetical protein
VIEHAFLKELDEAIRYGAHGAHTHGAKAPFALDEVDRVEDGWMVDHGDYAETNIDGVVVLMDKRRFRVTGWCDTTGWDGRSGMEFEELE